ncbi:MAG: DNA-binding response regulator [Ignavibacteriae bacterium]|nr:MAG: DNA-binding response regulator [Ignavibacteriota bacterium]
MYKLKILLADDHDSFRRILIAFLRAQKNIEVVGEAVNGQEAVEQTERCHPDLVLMDIHMPKQNGIEATKAIKNRCPGTKVFILSMDPSEFYRRNTQEFADGFIAKSSIKNALLRVLACEQTNYELANAVAA